ncbi:MAG: multicopper oxidase domain-containing protein, partial [Gemmatimonadaceae bacterium]
MIHRILLATTLAALAAPSLVREGAPPSARHRVSSEIVSPNDNRQPAGSLSNGVLTVNLETRTGTWYPESENGRGLEVAGWAEVGKPMQTPGPAIRVIAGTIVKATIHNTLAQPLTVYGFAAARGIKDSMVVAPGGTRSAEFTAGTPGTYYYAGQTTPGPIQGRTDVDAQLNGAIVVDPAGKPLSNDRVFLISWWTTNDTTSVSGLGRTTMAINGLSWPHTEKLDLVQHDSVHWRVINLTSLDHPMHLHGFYYRIDAKGDGVRDTLLEPRDRRMVVTEIVDPGQTMAMSFVPERAGNWIFHCHFAGHLSHLVAMDTDHGVAAPESDAHHAANAPHQMYGLVMGIRVAPRGKLAAAPKDARPIRLLMREKPNVYGTHPGYSFVLGGTAAAQVADSLVVPGPAIILERGKPVAVTIVNQSKDRAAVHWHGIELQSYPDGVPGWSGSGKDVLPSVGPGDSILVRFTPPRAGTFMYHSHFNEFQQITSGLYGPLIVLEPGQKLDPETDRVLMFSDGGPTVNVIRGPFAPTLLNGQEHPAPLEFKAGRTYRLRLINLTGDAPTELAIADGAKPIEWRALARDGMTLPE